MECAPFIVLEGQGFAGKTEQSKLLVARLAALGVPVWETQEPGGVPSAVAIREEILRKRAEGSLTTRQEFDLFNLSRKFYYQDGVKPKVKQGVWVVGTRSSASTDMYQGKEGGMSLEEIRSREAEVVGEAWHPDITFLLQTNPMSIWERLSSATNRVAHGFNEKDMWKLITRNQFYQEVALETPYRRWLIIDGSQSISSVQHEIWFEVMMRLGRHLPSHIELTPDLIWGPLHIDNRAMRM